MGCHLFVEGNERGGGQLCSHSQRTLGLMFRVRIRHRLPCQRVRLPGAWVSVGKRVGKIEEREPRLTGLAGLHPTFSDGPRVGGLALVEVPADEHRQQARRASTTRRPLPRSPCCWIAAHAGLGHALCLLGKTARHVHQFVLELRIHVHCCDATTLRTPAPTARLPYYHSFYRGRNSWCT